jgi:hypothetical protein
MTWRSTLGRWWEVANRQPDADGNIPSIPILDDTPAVVELERDTRIRHAANRIEIELHYQTSRPKACRNDELVDVLLGLRSTLRPSAPSPEVLRELPPVGHRLAAPTIPGGAL